MTRRLEAGPLLVTLGALLLLVSLFLSWFAGDITAWEAFEAWDLVLCALALAAIAAALGLTESAAPADRRALPAAVLAVAVIVASQIIDPPPAAAGQDPEIGAWLALAGALVMCVGAVLTFGRVHLAFEVEGRERRHVAAVDARGPKDQTTDAHPVVDADNTPATKRLFARERSSEPEPAPEPATAAAQPEGDGTAEEKQG